MTDDHAQLIAHSISLAFRIAGSETMKAEDFLHSISGNPLAHDIFSILPEDAEITKPMVYFLLNTSGHTDAIAYIEKEQHELDLQEASLALSRERGL